MVIMINKDCEKMSEDLLKCPFCGGEAEMCSDSDNIYGEYWYIRCKKCFGRGASYYESFSALVENERFFTIQRAWGNAIKAWNRRVVDEQ